MVRNVAVSRMVGDLSLSDSTPLAKLLDRCLQSNSLRDARRVHARIIKSPFAFQVFIQNRMIDGYTKCGCLEDARKLFEKMTHRNTFTYNSLITFTESDSLNSRGDPRPPFGAWMV
ncbi:hypothetical protein Dimus_025205 [Dionaea muscipula]